MTASNGAPGVFVIAEAGVNHNGALDLAQRLVDAAADAGADAVKFQTFRSDELATASAAKATYQRRATGDADGQIEMLRKLELDLDAHRRIADHCRDRGIEFMSTPFDVESVDALVALGVRRLKLPSGELVNPLLLRALAATGLPLIVSTGMSSLGEVEWALGVLAGTYLAATTRGAELAPIAPELALCAAAARRELAARVTLLHCTTEYPAPFGEVNLRAMATMAAAFALPVGYSDHTPGISVPIAAVALGACVIEKHLTLDRGLPGPDHAASLEPGELAAMVAAIRAVEQSLGDGVKSPTSSELPNRAVARRSLVASAKIRRGDAFTPANVTLKRPGTGVSAREYDAWMGRQATRDYEVDDLLRP